MPLPSTWKAPLRAVKRRLRDTLLEHTGYYTNHNVMDADIQTGGERFFVSLCAAGWRTCFDVGANIGDYARAVLAVNPACHVTCFEPVPELADRLRGELAGPQCRVVAAAVGDACGETTLYQSADHPGELHYSLHHGAASTAPLTVPVVTVDAYCEEAGIGHLDCCKIDAEGHEVATLHGMRRMLAEGRVDAIQFEYGFYTRHAGHTFREIVDLLAPQYRICHILPGGLLPLVYRSRIEEFGFSNWVALSRERYG